MSWMQKLYETYEKAQTMDITSGEILVPPCHTSQQAHIEITLDAEGNFLRASVVIPKEETIIPATEASAARTSGGGPHPLCDKIQYIAGDYSDYGGDKKSYFDDFRSGNEQKDGYLTLLTKWSAAADNPKLRAIRSYAEKRRVVADLVEAKVLFLDEKGQLLRKAPEGGEEPALFKEMTKKSGEVDPGDAFVRWRVEIPGDNESRVWKDNVLIDSWIRYDTSLHEQRGFCFVTGQERELCFLHPARIRHGADKAKLISSNDNTGFTFRGRFTDANQACTIGYEVTQKAHSALRWLVGRQAFRNDDQVIVAWEVTGKTIPPLMDYGENSVDAFFDELPAENSARYSGDMGQAYARELSRKIAGYRSTLGERDDIVVMALDSSTPGRMAITYYRELNGSELLNRLEAWHSAYAWYQRNSKDFSFIGAPAPKDIALAAWGRRSDGKILKTTISRILPCIVDGAPIPKDLVRAVFHRVVRREALEFWEFEKNIGIACGLYKGLHKEMDYDMMLETNRVTRDYLYGRLLAVAEVLESKALFIAKEKRETNAARLMQRFAERPYSTWKHIELALAPYRARLLGTKTLKDMDVLFDEIHGLFTADDYTNDAALSGEFLLGYHCQRRDLWAKHKTDENVDVSSDANPEEGN